MTPIRRIAAKDRQPILDLLASTGAFLAHELDVAMELVDTALNKPGQQDYLTYVLDAEDGIAAYACFGRNPMTRFTYDLYWLATRADRMRRGYGRAMFSFVEDEIRKLGGRLLVIETSSKPSYAGSRAFYLRVGCEFAASLPDFYDIGDDRVIYYKRLAS